MLVTLRFYLAVTPGCLDMLYLYGDLSHDDLLSSRDNNIV